nr:hypothetical protein GCM10020063_037860 [Dactylosporangium thailandense]
MPADQTAILAEIAEMLYAIRDHSGLEGEITMESTFQDDLGMESIDVVSLAGRLQARFGDTVNFAQFIAGLDVDAARHLRVGRLVEHIAASLDQADAGSGRVGMPA